MCRPHKAHAAPARQLTATLQLIAHHLRNRQLGNRLCQGFLQAFNQSSALGRALVIQRFSFAIHRSLETRNRRFICTKSLQFFQERWRGFAVCTQANTDWHEFLRHRFIRRARSHSRDVRCQAARRGKAGELGFRACQALRHQLIAQHRSKRITQLLKCLGRQLFNKQFNEKIFISHSNSQAAFFSICATHSRGAIGKPRRSRDS